MEYRSDNIRAIHPVPVNLYAFLERKPAPQAVNDGAMPCGPRSRPTGRAATRLAGKAASIAIAATWIVVTAYAVSLWVLP